MRVRHVMLVALLLGLAGCQAGLSPLASPPMPPTASGGAETNITPKPATASPSPPLPETPSPTLAPGAQSPTPSPPLSPPTDPPATPQPVPGPKLVTFSGAVFGEAGATVDGATVTLRSLDAQSPFTAEGTTSAGAWAISNVLYGPNLEVIATKVGWTTRRQVFADPHGMAPFRIDFGPPRAWSGFSYADRMFRNFLSPFPEVAQVDPAPGAKNVDGQRTAIRLTLSEALDASNRDRFAQAIRIWPASRTTGSPNAVDLSAFDNREPSDSLAAHGPLFTDGPPSAGVGYAVADGTSFGRAASASVTWDAEGRTATLAFPAPLLASTDEEVSYQIGLVSDGRPILDAEGRGLGTDYAGVHDRVPSKGQLVANAFLDSDLMYGLSGGGLDASAPWASTHRSVARFSLARDDSPPNMAAVAVSAVGDDLQFALTFSEAMVAYDGTVRGRIAAGTLNVSNYTFAIGVDRADVAPVDLKGAKGGEPMSLDPRSALGGFVDPGREFVFAPEALRTDGDLASAQPGEVVLAVEARTPATVYLTVKGRKDLFAPTLHAIKARAVNIGDPSGNVIVEAMADSYEVVGKL